MGLQPDNKVGDNHYHGREESQIPVRFEGNLARELGIYGTFDQGVSDRLFRGMKPELVDGKEQKLTLRIDKDRVGAVDWTFNVDKSVSGAELVGGDSRILGVRERAVTAAMDYVEENSRVRVRKGAEVAKAKPKTYKFPARYTDSLIYERHWHTVARDGSPHGHCHVKIYNLSKDRVEDAVKAVELRFVDRKAANEVYNRWLKRGLNELGYKTRRKGESLELVGFPAEVKAIFSPRHESIKELERSYEERAGKPMSSKAKGKLSVYNRPEKPDNMPLVERRKGWLGKLTAPQAKAVHGLVGKAKLSVKRSKWRAGLKRHLDRFRPTAVTKDTPAQTKEPSRGR